MAVNYHWALSGNFLYLNRSFSQSECNGQNEMNAFAGIALPLVAEWKDKMFPETSIVGNILILNGMAFIVKEFFVDYSLRTNTRN